MSGLFQLRYRIADHARAEQLRPALAAYGSGATRMGDASRGGMHLERNEADRAATDRVRTSVASGARLPPDLVAEDAIAAAMCALVDRLTAGEAHHLFEALPASTRSLFSICVRHRTGQPTMKLDRVAFLERVAEHLGVTPAHAEIVCAAVFEAVRLELPDGLVDDIAHQLPRGLKELWLAGPRLEAPPVEATLSAEDARAAIESEIAESASLPEGAVASDVFAAVMCALSQRLSGGEARELAFGLPETLRGLVVRCATHRSEEAEVFGCDELFRRVCVHLYLDPSAERACAESLVRVTFRATKRVLPERATLDVASQLPVPLRELWESA